MFKAQLVFANVGDINHVCCTTMGTCLLVVKVSCHPLIIFGCNCTSLIEAHQLLVVILDPPTPTPFSI